MTALTAARTTPTRIMSSRMLPLAANAKGYQGGMVAISTANGYANKASVATTLRCAGIAAANFDNTGGADGASSVEVRTGTWLMLNSASTDQITRADIGNSCYMVDDQTVAKTNGSTTRSIAGTIADIDSATGGVWVTFA